jgi:phosphate transport system permease protein
LATREISIAAPRRLEASRKRWGEYGIMGVLALCALVSILTTIGIIVALLQPAIDFFRSVNPIDFITGTQWSPLFSPAHFGVLPLVVGTFVVALWGAIVCIPFGLGSAIYLSEYARPRTRKILKPALEVLAGVPTVVYGFFALVFLTPLLRDIGLHVEIFNVLSGGLVIGVMLIPTVASLSEDAMRAVPQALRDGAYGIGATRMQVSTKVVVPAAISGIVASFVLAISRAVGETMIVLIAVGQQPGLHFDPLRGIETMSAFIAATGQGDVPRGTIEYKTIFAVALTLFVITFVLNAISIRLVRKYREVYE